MATVYLAIQENFQREVALKIMSPSLSEDSEFSERFIREARIVSSLVHPNIVTVHDVGIENGHHYLSMEYIDGRDLKQCLPDLSGEQIFQVVEDVARALDYAGKKGYVHRDVKPENIMLHKRDGRAVLMDFGIARATDAATSMTRTGTALGTPYYMSPEQARGKPIDGRSDLYSLGVLLYYMMVGNVPYDAESPVAIGIKHISEAIPRLPRELADYQPLIDRLLAKKPEVRYQSGEQLLADLEAINASALNLWREQRHMEYSDLQSADRDKHRTPLRNEAAQESAADEPAGGAKLQGDVTGPVEGRVEDRVKTTTGTDFTSGPDLNTVPGLSSPSIDEALHIPPEDRKNRQPQQQGGGGLGKFILLLVLLLALLSGTGYYYSDKLLALLPESAAVPVSKLMSRVDQALPDIIARFQGVTSAVSGAVNSDENNDSQAEPRPDSAADATENKLKELVGRSQDLAGKITEQPERTGELITLYREILQLQPEHSDTTVALVAIRQQAISAIASQLEAGADSDVEQRIADTLRWFPELATDSYFVQLRQGLNQAQEIGRLLAEAEQFYAKDRLLFPKVGNARQRYDQVLALQPDNPQALQGLKKIVERYWVLARSGLQKKDYKNALLRVEKGLSIDPAHSKLLSLQKQLAVAIKRQQALASLLAEAEGFEQQQLLFGRGDNAAQRYLAVLAQEPNHPAAGAGLTRILGLLYSRFDELVAGKEYDRAGALVQAGLESLPDNDRLLSLLLELESYKPVVESLRLSGQPIELGLAQPRTITVDRTLHIAFRYRNLDKPTTVLQVLLFDGGRTVQIAASPVVVMGREGNTRFRIDRPVEGFSAGGYHLDVLLAGRRIFTSAFVID